MERQEHVRAIDGTRITNDPNDAHSPRHPDISRMYGTDPNSRTSPLKIDQLQTTGNDMVIPRFLFQPGLGKSPPAFRTVDHQGPDLGKLSAGHCPEHKNQKQPQEKTP